MVAATGCPFALSWGDGEDLGEVQWQLEVVVGSMHPSQGTPEAGSMHPAQGKACDTPSEHRLSSHLGKATYFPATASGGLMAQHMIQCRFRIAKGPQPEVVIVSGWPCMDLKAMDS